MKVEHILTTINRMIQEVKKEENDYYGANWRRGTEFVLICWETYSRNPTIYHPANIFDARKLAEYKLQCCKQVVLQFWKAGLLYAQQTAWTNEQARNLGNKEIIYNRYG